MIQRLFKYLISNLFIYNLILITSFSNSAGASFNFKDYKEQPNILIVSGYHYKKLVSSIADQLPDSRYKLSISYLKKQELITKIEPDVDFVITIGRESTLRVNEYLAAQNDPAPLLAVLIPHKMYNSIKKETNNKNKNRQISAIYREQPIERQLKVIKDILPQSKTIGILTSMYDTTVIDELRREISKHKLKLYITENHKRENLIDSLRHVLSNCDVLLTLPDPEIYNPFTAKGILVTSFRRNIPIIGYSKTYVDAGAVAAVYTKPLDIARQATAITKTYFLTNNLSPPSYPTEFSVAQNKKVLENLKDKKKS